MAKKRVCEICGTVFDENRDVCPLCDTPYQADLDETQVFSAAELEAAAAAGKKKKQKKRNCFLLPGSYPFYRIPEVQLP